MDELFSIGDVARLFHLSPGTLRHYERAGLLTPEYVAPGSGYRYYGPRQFEALNTIRYLRALDMPLDEIADFLRNRDVDRIDEKLRQQKQIIAQKQCELMRIERRIDHRLQRLHDAREAELDTIQCWQSPPCRVVWLREALKLHSFLDMETPIRRLEQSQAEAVVFLGKVGVSVSQAHLEAGRFDEYDGAFLVLDEEDRFDGETTLLPEISCVRVRFRGSHPEASAQYRRLMDYIGAHQLRVAGFSREITLIDYGFTNDVQKFVTEIYIPVAELAEDK